MRTKSLLLLILALGCGTVASIGITQVMAKRGQMPTLPKDKMVSIFVALEDISMGDPINAQMLKLEDWPRDKAPEGVLTKLEDVETRRPKTRILKGMPILENQLLAKGATNAPTAQIPKGMRVVTVNVDDVSSLNGMIRPSDRVDVVALFKKSTDVPQTMTKTILQDVKVFAVNDIYELEKTTGEKKVAAKTVSLLVTPRQAESLTLAETLGKVRLTMRSLEDETQATVSDISINELFNIPEPQSQPVPPVPQAVPAPDKSNAVFDLMKAMAAGLQGKKPEAENWSTRLVTPEQVQDVKMEPVSSASGSAKSPVEYWRVTEVVTHSTREGDGKRGSKAAAPPKSASGTASSGEASAKSEGGDSADSSAKSPPASDLEESKKVSDILGLSDATGKDDKN